MAFDKPQSRNEAILQNMLGANNELEPPKSRVEALLQDIAGQMPEANPSEGTTTGTLERLKIGDDIYTVEGGGSGTSDYDALNNKPQIAGVTLSGNKSLADLDIASASAVSGILDGTDIDSFGDVETALGDKVDKVNGKGLSTNDYDDDEKAAVAAATTAIAGIKDGTSIDSFADVETAIGAIQDGQSIDSFADVESAIGAIEDGTTIDSFADVESALADKQDATDSNLQTTADTIVGAINEHEGDIGSLKSGFTSLDTEVNGDATVYPYADVITIPDAVPSNIAECNVKVEPVQDLHGQSAPYVGGAGKNKLPLTLTGIKANNVYGTWNDNVYTLAGVTYTVYTDDGGNVTGIKVNGTYNGSGTYLSFWIPGGVTLPAGTYVYSSGMTATQANLRIRCNDGAFFSYTTNEITKTYEADTHIDIEIVLNQGDTVENAMLYPMIRLATETDATFAPYTNICPITGHTEASVQRDGNDVWTGNDSYTIASAGHVIPNTTIALPVGTYALDFEASNPSGAFEFEVFKGNSVDWANRLVDKVFTAKARNIVKFTLTETSTNLRLYSTAGASISNVRLFSTVQTYTIALGDTIYGGTVDFDSGVMTVDRALVDLGSLDWAYNSDGFFFTADPSGMKQPASAANKPNWMLTCYNAVSYNNFVNIYANGTAAEGNGYTRIVNTAYTDASDFKTAMTGQKLVYELATPTTIQLTPQQIQLLKGTNTLYASTGDISVTVNGVSGSIGAVQEQVNELAEEVAEIKPVNYSTTEQKTGQKWIDGKDIYFCTFTGLTLTTTANWQDTGIDSSNIDTIIGGLAIDDSKQSIVCSFGFGTNPTVILRAYMSTNVIKSVTLYYTKTA